MITSLFTSHKKQHGPKHCEKFEEIPIPNRVVSELSQLPIRCIYARNGCTVISFYYDLERHEKQCEYEKIPCEICQLPLSKRPPIIEHTKRACFEHMHNKNPSGVQEQFMTLFNGLEETKAENRRLESTIKNMQTELKHLNELQAKTNNTVAK